MLSTSFSDDDGRRRGARIVGAAAAYGITAILSLSLAIPPGYATAVWPASGIALVAVLLYGRGVWPGILIGSFLANVWTGFDGGGAVDWNTVLVPLGIGVGAACQAVVGAFLVRRYAGFPNLLSSEREILLFFLWGGAVACMVNSVIGVSVLWAAGVVPGSSLFINVGTWWIGDTIGVILFSPVLLVWTLRPREVWAPRAMTVTLPIVVSFVVSVFIVAIAADWERERMRLQFDRQVSPLGQSLKKTLHEYLGAVTFLEAHLAAAPHVTRADFRTFAERLLSRLGGIQAVSWNPVVTDGERRAFEERKRREGFPSFRISERNADGELAAAARRDSYTVVDFIEPFAGNRKAFGFDVASNETRRAALAAARDTGQAVATGRITLVQETGRQFGVLVFIPVYRYGLPAGTVDERRRNLAGYAVGVFRGGDMVSSAFQELDTSGVVYRLVDTSSRDGEELLIENHPRSDSIFVLEEHGLFGGSMDFRKSVPISFGGRAWRLELAPDQHFFARHREKSEWFILIGGMVMTIFVSAFVMLLSGREERLRQLVEERTDHLKKALDEAEAASRVKSEFLSVVSHELRTPLTSIRGALGLLDAHMVGDLTEKGAKLVDVASRNAERLNLLVDDILDMEKIQSGRFELKKTAIDVGDLVARSMETNRPYAQRLGVDIRLDAEQPRMSVSADESRVLQILANLISNAAKFSPTGETIVLSWREHLLERDGGSVPGVRISVTDRGPGIPESFRRRIFRPFEQADASASRGVGGTGLGLSICRTIAEQHGGAMSFDTVEGEGTTFHLDLPRTEGEA